MKSEIELKFCPVDKDEMRKKLSNVGFIMTSPEFLMQRVTLHNPNLPDRWARVRQEYGKITLTIKRVLKEAIDGTEEEEVNVSSFEGAIDLMIAAGFRKTSYQENYRETWDKDGVEAAIDTWPGLPPLVELEGPDESSVYNAVELLGLDRNEAKFGSVDYTYERVMGIPRKVIYTIPEITFANPPKKP